MKNILAHLVVILALAANYSFGQRIAVRNVNVVNTVGDALQKNVTVLIEKDRIVRIGRSVKIPKGTTIVNGEGKYLMPGLIDMHIHTRGEEDVVLPLLLANGVVGVRELANYRKWRHIGKWRDSLNNTGSAIPYMLAVAGHVIDGPGDPQGKHLYTVTTADEARKGVEAMQKVGADFIKVYENLSLECYEAIAKEAKRRNMTVVGHTSRFVPLSKLIASGQKSIEHMDGFYLFMSSKEDSLRKCFADSANSKTVLRSLAMYDVCYETLDTGRVRTIARVLKQNKIFVCPTISNSYTFDSSNVYDHFRVRHLDKIPVNIKAAWKAYSFDETAEDSTRFAHYEVWQRYMLKVFIEEGVSLIAGTDAAPGMWYTVPGYIMPFELEMYVSCGMKPIDAIRSATVNSARFLHRDNDWGSVAEGKLANVLLLDANPLDNVGNLRKIHAVILNGKLHDREELDRIISEADAKLKNRQ